VTPTITAFANSPDRGRGLARDMGARWALDEVDAQYADFAVAADAKAKQEARP
jgi:glutathione S-transferase